MTRAFRPYSLEQQLLLPPDLREWVPEGDLVWFLSDTVDELDLSAIINSYEHGDGRGQPPYHPAMMVKLLVYAYCVGLPSSRKIERATHRDVAFRALAGNQHPDHDSIAEFRRRHLPALANLFVQVLRLCQAAGLVTLGHIALDGTKIRANASRHKAMSYARMEQTERQLQDEVRRLLADAERVDAAEEAEFGPGRRGDELPAELARRETRLAKIRALKAALEREARERAAQAADAARAKLAAREQRTGRQKSRPAKVPDPGAARPAPTAQRNFTDPDSRIMTDSATDSFVQGYTAEAAADSHAQIVVACHVTNAAQDVEQFAPLLTQIAALTGRWPAVVTADAGFFSEANLCVAHSRGVDAYIPPDRDRHGGAPGTGPAASNRRGAASEQMRAKLRTALGEVIYRRRKAIVEPVFAYIKDRRGFRRFSFRSLAKVCAEWAMICLTHNLLKLYRVRACPSPV